MESIIKREKSKNNQSNNLQSESEINNDSIEASSLSSESEMSDIVENNSKINWKLTTEAPRNSFMMDDEIRNFIEPEYDYIGQVQNIPNSISENSTPMDFLVFYYLTVLLTI